MTKNNHLQPHELSKLFPPLDQDAAVELAMDIKQHGLRHPIVTFEDKILDGVQRYGACQDAKVEPEVQEFETMEAFRQGTHPVDFVMSLNAHRRHLSKGQRATITADAERLKQKKFTTYEELKERARKSYRESEIAEGKKAVGVTGKIPVRKTNAQLAAEAQVSERLIDMAQRVAKETPRKIPAIKAGKLALHDAYKALPPTERQKQNAEARAEKLRAGLTLEDTIGKLRAKAAKNGGQIYVELGGYGFRCFQLCRSKW
jgi:hypothetical protein